MSKDKTGSWFQRHKVLSVIAVLVVIGIIAGAAGGSNSNTDSVKNGNENRTTDSTDSNTKPQVETLTITNSVASDKGYGVTQVDGEITNNVEKKHSATLKATFYSADGKIMGTAVGAINDLAPGETKTFSLMTTDNITGYTEMKVQVDTLI